MEPYAAPPRGSREVLGGYICLLQTLPLDLETCHIWREESRANNRAPYLKTQHGCHVLPSSSETQYHPMRLGRPTTVSTLRATMGRVFDVLFLFMSSFLRRGATVSRGVRLNPDFSMLFTKTVSDACRASERAPTMRTPGQSVSFCVIPANRGVPYWVVLLSKEITLNRNPPLSPEISRPVVCMNALIAGPDVIATIQKPNNRVQATARSLRLALCSASLHTPPPFSGRS